MTQDENKNQNQPGAPRGALGLQSISDFINSLESLDEMGPRSSDEVLSSWGVSASTVPRRVGLTQEESTRLEETMYRYADAYAASDADELRRIEAEAQGIYFLEWAVGALQTCYKENENLAPGSDPLVGIPLTLLRPQAEVVRFRPGGGRSWLKAFFQRRPELGEGKPWEVL